jgi:hypothetical protein
MSNEFHYIACQGNVAEIWDIILFIIIIIFTCPRKEGRERIRINDFRFMKRNL